MKPNRLKLRMLFAFFAIYMGAMAQKELVQKTNHKIPNFCLKDSSILDYQIVKFSIDSLALDDYHFNFKGDDIFLKGGSFRINELGYRIWAGDKKQKRIINSLIISRNKKYSGYIVTSDKLYKISPLSDKYHVITMHNHNIPFNECDTEPDTIKQDYTTSLKSTTASSSNCSSYDIFRVVIAYTPEFKATFSNQTNLNNFLIQVIESIN